LISYQENDINQAWIIFMCFEKLSFFKIKKITLMEKVRI